MYKLSKNITQHVIIYTFKNVDLLKNIAFRISLAKKALFSLAFPDGDGLQIDRNVRYEDLVGNRIASVPVIGTGTMKRQINRSLLLFASFYQVLLDALRGFVDVVIVIVVTDIGLVIVDVIVIIVDIITRSVMAVQHCSRCR